jgi:hypothetical protein
MITYLPKSGPPDAAAVVAVEFVGGPWEGRRDRRADTPDLITVDGGAYRRSVRCADDAALRYVFEADPAEIAHRRVLQPG